MDSTDSNFRTYSLGGIERLSLPAVLTRTTRKRLLSLYKPQRLTAKLAWKLFPLLPGNLKFGRLYAVQPKLSVQVQTFHWQTWLNEVEEVLQSNSLIPAFYYPPDTERRKFSILLTDPSGNLQAYAKLAWKGSLQQQHLQNERKAAELLGTLGLRSFDYPKLIHSGYFEETEYNLFQPIKDDCQSLQNRWEQLHNAYWQEMKHATARQFELRQLTWWEQTNRLDGDWLPLAQWLEDHYSSITCCAAHGDFVPWNLCSSGQTLMIYDWEYFESNAPALLDPVYFVLSLAARYTPKSSCEELLSLLSRNLPEESKQPHWMADLALAFCYLRLQSVHGSIMGLLDKCAAQFKSKLVP